jgi:hypothetical protein
MHMLKVGDKVQYWLGDFGTTMEVIGITWDRIVCRMDGSNQVMEFNSKIGGQIIDSLGWDGTQAGAPFIILKPDAGCELEYLLIRSEMDQMRISVGKGGQDEGM